MSPLPWSGLGLGWRPEIAGLISALPGLRFCEVIAESLRGGAPPPALGVLRARGVTVIPHGISLSLGGTEPVARKRVAHLAACAQRLGSPLVSEHIAVVRAGGMEAGHLLSVPRSREALDVLVRNVRHAQQRLPVPLALEPIAALFDWPDDEFSEADFLVELLWRTDAWLLLDIANVSATAVNRGGDPAELLEKLPLERVAYVHVAGGAEHDGLYHDTHTHPTPHAVLQLLAELCARRRPPAIMLERDGAYPPAAELYAELDLIADAASVTRITG
jgi:uncharacterized protein (UPF0276 family)